VLLLHAVEGLGVLEPKVVPGGGSGVVVAPISVSVGGRVDEGARWRPRRGGGGDDRGCGP
jgi:hypothetical protein